VNILMMTNTFTPHVGGVARSVSFFTHELRAMGHRVVVVAPEFEDMPEQEEDVIRVPAIQNFNGSDFSVIIPVPGYLEAKLEEDFQPDVVHSHHPFLLGSTALRVASQYQIPLVFTHHTMYEQYTHYVPGDSQRMKVFAVKQATGYCNLCDAVVAPSESVAAILRERGVTVPIQSIPTGVYIEEFQRGDGLRLRRQFGLAPEDRVIGHLGRLAPEKNLPFLARAVSQYLATTDRGHFLVVGGGPSVDEIQAIFDDAGLGDRLHLTGSLSGQDLVDAYHAMDVFAFASKSETQGMVLVEALAAGVPVVALDANGAREVVRDGCNGRLLPHEEEAPFAAALADVVDQLERDPEPLRRGALATAREFAMPRCAERLQALYLQVQRISEFHHMADHSIWRAALEELKAEWDILANLTEAAVAALEEEVEPEEDAGAST